MSTLDQPADPVRRLRRIAIGCAIGVAGLLALRFGAGLLADRRWAAERELLLADGVALDMAELNRPATPEDENAATLYRQASALIRDNTAAENGPRGGILDIDSLGQFPPYWSAWWEVVQPMEAAAMPALKLARQARERPTVDWGIRYRPPTLGTLLPHLNGARALANVLGDAAELSILRGESREGIERIRDLFAQAKAVSADNPLLVTSLVAMGIDAMGCSALSPHVGQLAIDDVNPNHATPAQIRTLIAELLVDEPGDGLKRGMVNETTFALATAEELPAGAWMVRPVVSADRTRLGERGRLAAKAMREPSAAARAAVLAQIPAKPKAPRFGLPLTNELAYDDYGRTVVMTNRVRGARDALAIMLAMRLYELDHAGRWPATLEALVPNYLPRLPTDAQSLNESPYRYAFELNGLPDGRDRPLLGRGLSLKPSTQPATWPRNGAFGKPEYEAQKTLVDLTSWVPPPVAIAQPTADDGPTTLP